MSQSAGPNTHDRWAWIKLLPPSAFVLDSDRIVQAVNDSAVDEFGYKPEELIGKPADFLIPDYAWPPTSGGLNLSVAAETAEGLIEPVDIFVGPADESDSDFHLVMIESVEYETEEVDQERESSARELLTEVGSIISSNLETDSVYEQFSAAIMRFMPTERLAISEYDLEFEDYRVINAFPAIPPGNRIGLTPTSDATADAFETQAPVSVTGDEVDELLNGELAPLGWNSVSIDSIVIVPLIAGYNRIGLLYLASSRIDAFTTDDIRLLGQLSGQAAGAISNLLLHDDLQKESSERQLLANVARQASEAIDFSTTVGSIARELAEHIPMLRLEISVIDQIDAEEATRHRWSADSTNLTTSDRFMFDGSLEQKIAEQIHPIFVSGKEIDDLGSKVVAPELDSTKWGSLVSVPMTMLNRVIGIITVRAESRSAFNLKHVDLLTRVADQLAGALQVSQMFLKQQKEAEIKRSLAAISVAVSEDLDLGQVFQRVSDELAVLVKYDHLMISSVQHDGEEPWQTFSMGVDYIAPSRDQHLMETEEQWSGFYTGERPDGPVGESMERTGLNSLIEVPLGTQAAGHIGYLTIMNNEPHAYKMQDLDLVAQVAAQVTPAIQNAKSHEQALQLAESREQQALLEAKSLELERINEAKSQFLAMVSHELRTPLTSISAYTDLLERNKVGNLSDKQVRQLGVVKRNSAHLSRLISDLLDISKLESASFTLTKESFNLSTVLIELSESLAPLAAKSKDTIHVDVDSGIEMVGDRQKITQVVSNLIENAVKYSSDGSDIKLKCSTSESVVTVQVSDNGYGIPEADQERIFETFVRSKTDENWEIPGTGLGLALVKRITTMHGGHIDLVSKPGKGSTFTLKFPIIGIDTSARKDRNAQMSAEEEAAEQQLQEYRQKMLDESNEQSDTAA